MGIETIALVATVAGAGMQAMGAIQQGQAAKANANYQAQIADMNSKISKQNADYERALGEEKQVEQQLKTKSIVGAMEASQGANNLDINSGSNLDVRTSAMNLGRFDALTIKSDSNRRAYEFEQDAANKTSQAGAFRAEGKNDMLSAWISAGSSILGGASQAGNQYSRAHAQSGYDPLGVY